MHDNSPMTIVTFLSSTGQTVAALDVRHGESLMHAAVHANLAGIEGECGGCLSCATCHVYVQAGEQGLAPPSEDEVGLLDFVAAERRSTSRLSCQLLGSVEIESLTVQFPERQVA